jgi:hypothetical protein
MHTLATVALLLAMSSPITPPSGQPAPMKPGDFTPAGNARVVSWQVKRLAPPTAVYVQVDDVLRVAAASSQTNEVVTVSYRWLRAADGTVDYGQFTVAPAADRSIKITDQPMAEGFLLSVSCKAAIATTRGQTFVRLFLNPKALGAGQPGYMLMADYVTTAMAPGHPNGRILAPSEGPGTLRTVQLGLQPAGLDWTVAVPLNARWRHIATLADLQTAGGGVARQVGINVNPAGAFVWTLFAPGTQAGGITTAYHLSAQSAIYTAATATMTTMLVPLPPELVLLAGGSISSQTTGILAGDQWFQINVLVEEWLDNV